MDDVQVPDKKLPNTRLQHERALKGWSQEYVAKEIDTSAKNVSRWECGDKPIPYYRQRLCTLFGKNAQELGFLDRESSDDGDLQEANFEAASTPHESSPTQPISSIHLDGRQPLQIDVTVHIP